ncbi:MAG: hypothetical protein Q8P67_05785, partial [archaeon]|nr:hypothetical protein [archaeon]
DGANAVDLLLGTTRVVATVSSTEAVPDVSRPTEGFYSFDTQIAPLASEEALVTVNSKSRSRTVETARMLEKSLRNSKAIDTEALCVLAHEKVLSVRTDVRLLDDGGNFTGAASIAAIAALKRFRKPASASLDSSPLPLHHLPIAISFALFEGGHAIVDPTWKEEQAMEGSLVITMNKHGEICALQKSGGLPLDCTQVVQCAEIASAKVAEITEYLLSVMPDV